VGPADEENFLFLEYEKRVVGNDDDDDERNWSTKRKC
jgi:hypothetical protein